LSRDKDLGEILKYNHQDLLTVEQPVGFAGKTKIDILSVAMGMDGE
jgi:hypothetical protein